MVDRELWLANVFVELADTLVDDYDLVDFLSTLCERCAELLEGPDVGVMLMDPAGRLRHMASSTERMEMVELLELQHDEGPCLDCFATGTSVLNQRLDTATERWPNFVPLALGAGYRMVTTLPMRSRATVIGAVNIFHSDVEVIEPLEMSLTQALADVATIGIIQERSYAGAAQLAAQLQSALTSRVTIEQAKGMIGAQLGESVDEAFVLLRSYARAHNARIVGVAAAILDRSLRATALREARKVPPPSASRRGRRDRPL